TAINHLAGVQVVQVLTAGGLAQTLLEGGGVGSVPLHLTTADSGTTIAVSSPGTEQLVFVDTSGGATTLNLPLLGGVQDGQTVTLIDDGAVAGVQCVSWMHATLTCAGSGLDQIEDPNNGGTFAYSVHPIAQPGAKFSVIAN